MSDWLIAMTAGPWQLDGILKAKAMGYKVLGVDGSALAEGLVLCDAQLVVDINSKSELLEGIHSLGVTPAGVFSYCSEAGMVPAAWVREHYSLPGPSVDLANRLVNKALQRKVWRDSGIDNMHWHASSDLEELFKSADELGYPLVVKPVDSSGSRGVSIVKSPTDLKSSLLLAKTCSKAENVIVEEFCEGIEYAIETFTVDGKTTILLVTEKLKVPGSAGTVACELVSSNISDGMKQKITSKVCDAIESLGYTDGPGHTEIILTPANEVKLIEFAGRGGGFGVFSKLIPFSCGIDVTELLIQQSLGIKVGSELTSIGSAYCAIKFFPILTSGKVKKISGIDSLNEIKNVEAGSYVSEGEVVNQAFNDGARFGYAMFKAESHAELARLSELADSKVHYEVEA